MRLVWGDGFVVGDFAVRLTTLVSLIVVARLVLFVVMPQLCFNAGVAVRRRRSSSGIAAAAAFLDLWSLLVGRVVVLLLFRQIFDGLSFFNHECSEEEIDSKDAETNAKDGIVARVIVDDASQEREDE